MKGGMAAECLHANMRDPGRAINQELTTARPGDEPGLMLKISILRQKLVENSWRKVLAKLYSYAIIRSQ